MPSEIDPWPTSCQTSTSPHSADHAGKTAGLKSQASIPDTKEPVYWNDPTPLHYFERWSLSELSAAARDSIQGRLLQIHGAFLNNEVGEPTHVLCWRKTFNVLAGEFFKAGLLTEQMLITTIPGMVADASASGRWLWGRHSCSCPTDDFSEQVGTEFWRPGFIQAFFRRHLEGTITTWRGRQLSHAPLLAEVTNRPLAKPPAGKVGRPVTRVDGERIRELRGGLAQAVFARLCQISVDALCLAERHGRSSESTIRKILRRVKRQGQRIALDDLIKNTP
jgi:DNA-binding transcriptional regulator YiaG